MIITGFLQKLFEHSPWFFKNRVFVNESVNNEIPEKKVCLGVYTPKHTFFSGIHTTVDQNKNG